MKRFFILGALVFTFSLAFSQQPLYQYYNTGIQKHFYTTNFNEFGRGRDGWRYEQVACRVFTSDNKQRGLVPLYRYYNSRTRDHYYSTRSDWHIAHAGYAFEMPACYIFNYQARGTVPFYEYYNQTTGDHFFSTDEFEIGPGHPGVRFNKIAGYVFPK